MKDFADWDEDYVLNGIPLGEHDWVEFKRSEKLDLTLPGAQQSDVIAELSKQLSAFANSGGGAIVYGVDDNRTVRRVDGSGGVSMFIKKNGTKEWLEDIIPNAVEFQLEDFNVYSIVGNSPESQIQPDKAIFVIRVGDSDRAPHQANDKVYYSRVGGKSKPISHRMVMDITSRQKHPEIELEGEIVMDHSYARSKDVPTLILRYRNAGRIYASYVNGWINVPSVICKNHFGETANYGGVEYCQEYFENTVKETVGYRKGGRQIPGPGGQSMFMSVDEPLTLSRFDPVLPRLSRRAFYHETLEVGELEQYRDLKILWTVYADNAAPRSGAIILGDLIEKSPIKDSQSYSAN